MEAPVNAADPDRLTAPERRSEDPDAALRPQADSSGAKRSSLPVIAHPRELALGGAPGAGELFHEVGGIARYQGCCRHDPGP